MLILPKHMAAPAVDPLTMFPQGGGAADGWWFRVNDLSTMFQDQQATACAVGSEVRFMYSLAHDYTARGANLTANPTWDVNTTSWTGVAATLSSVGGRLRVTATGGGVPRAHQAHAVTVGDCYEVIVDLKTNANGAAIAVGTTNSTSGHALLTFAAGVTQNAITFRFVAGVASQFVQLRCTTSTAGHFTEWDNISVRRIPGRHMCNPTPGTGLILRQHATLGFYWLENVDGTRCLAGAAGLAIAPGGYNAVGVDRGTALISNSFYGANGSSTSYHRFAGNTGRSYAAQLRDASSSVSDQALGNIWPDDRRGVMDSLIGVESFDHTFGRRPVTSTPATGFVGFNGGPAFCATMNTVGGTPSVNAGNVKINSAMYSTITPGANRPGIRAYMANEMFAD